MDKLFCSVCEDEAMPLFPLFKVRYAFQGCDTKEAVMCQFCIDYGKKKSGMTVYLQQPLTIP